MKDNSYYQLVKDINAIRRIHANTPGAISVKIKTDLTIQENGKVKRQYIIQHCFAIDQSFDLFPPTAKIKTIINKLQTILTYERANNESRQRRSLALYV